MSALRRELRVDDPLAAAEHPSAAAGEDGGDPTAGRMRVIPIDVIDPNPNQPRRRFDGPALAALADSIRERGVLQPVIVRPLGGRYSLVAGERRWRAARLAGQPAIPALVNDTLDEPGSLELALIENLVREDLSPIEEARTFAVLLEDLHMTQTALAQKVGRSRADIANTVRLLDLPDEVIELVDTAALSKGHGKALLAEPEHHRRRQLARQAIQSGWSVRTLEAAIGRASASPAPRRRPGADQVAVAVRLQDTIARAIGHEARAVPHRDGVQIILDAPAAARLQEILGNEIAAL
jgi:ParB family transcriptional regulator, chromosome partitioning protein